MTSTINPAKQRKLSDLRVIDLQRELRSFNISYDKKELKGSLLEKLRQALVNRNIDPENYLFDISADLKSISSDENNRNLEENGSYEANNSEISTMEIDSEQQPENPVQTNPTSSLSTNETDDEQNGQTNRIDTMDLRQMVEEYDDDNLILTIDQTTTKQEDENNNDKIDPHLKQLSGFSFDEELDNKNLTHPNLRNTPIDQQTSVDSNNGEELQPSTTTTTGLSNDNDNLSKSEISRQESNDEQTKKDNTNKDQCHLWVSNIAKETHASDLKELFSKYGKVLTTKVIGSSSSQWFGYINLATPDDVQKCINALDQTELHGKKIYVDREMHDQPSHSSSSKSKSNSSSTSLSNTHEKRSDYKSSSNSSYRKRDSITDSHKKSSTTEGNTPSKKRPASTSNENKKKLSTADVNKSNNDERTTSTHETDSTNKKSSDETHRNSSGSTHSQSSKYHTARTDALKSESSHKSSTNDRKSDKNSNRSEKSSTNDAPTSKTSSPTSNRSHSSEKRSNPPLNKSDHHRSSSTDKSRQQTPSNKYDKPKDTHRSTTSNTFDNDRRSTYQNEQRLRHEKEVLERKQYVQHQEEEKIKEQQRRLAEERERMRREFEILERERLEIERTRLVLEKEKQDQARELEKQQRRLADEAKHRQQQVEAKIRDEKLHRISQNDNKRSRSSHHESQRSHHSNTNNNNNNNNSSNNSHSNKGYDHRSSTNATSGRGRDRSLGDTNRDYYPEPKRPYNNNSNNQREQIFRDRVVYRDSDLPTSSSNYGINSSSMSSNNNNQRYLPSSSNQHRLVDPYNTLPQRGRDMALPPTSSTAYERSSRNAGSPLSNPNALIRRPHSRERFDDREYMQQAQRRGRSPPPPPPNPLRREPMESQHWERSKSRDTAHYNDDSHKYLPAQYLSESSQSTSQQQQQQQGLWSAAPPSRQPHHHPDLSLKTVSHAPGVDSYGWQRVSQQVPPQPLPSHHQQGLSSSHDRSRANMPNNPRIPILSPNQPPPPPPSSRGSTAGQTHLYNHPGVPVNALPTSHGSLAQPPPPPPLHHATAYVTQPAPPAGLVLHPTGQTRAYEQHYVVTQPLQQRRY